MQTQEKICYDVKNVSMTSKVCHDVIIFIMMVKICLDVQKCVMMTKSETSHSQILLTLGP